MTLRASTVSGSPSATNRTWKLRVASAFDRRHARAVSNLRAELGGPPGEQIVEAEAGDPEGRRGQLERHRPAGSKVQESALDALGFGLDGVQDAEAPQVRLRGAGEKLAADLGARKAVLLEDERPMPGHGEGCRRRGSGRAGADDEGVARAHASAVTRRP